VVGDGVGAVAGWIADKLSDFDEKGESVSEAA